MVRTVFVKAFAALLVIVSGALAQEVNATLNGSVSDPSGATVQGASILIHNNDTNTDLRTVTSDAGGEFTVTNLPAAVYTVTVKATGFRTFLSSNVVLHVAEKRSLPVQLQTGQVNETVNVTETSIPVQTSTSAQAGTITGTQVRELQLNNRNFEQLVTLQPGVTSGLPDIINFGISNTSSVVINGARTGANNWTVDGADINDSGSNATLLNVPSVDAIQEFTLARSGYDAQYGRSGGGQILTVTKSGTSQFHGDLYEFVRNDKFNANSFFSNLVGAKKPPLRYNDYGFTIGGPLFIPKLYSRKESQTFFFWSEEWRKTGQPSSNTAVVPTAGQLNGTFTGVVLNPASAPAGCVTNTTPANAKTNVSQINPACFSNNAKVYIQNVYSKFPANAGNGTQYISNTVAKNNYRQDIVRLDQNVTDKIHAFGRFMQDQVPTTEPGGLFASSPLPNIFSTSTNAPGKNVVANVSWAISPTVVNEAAFNYSWGAINSNLTGINNSPALYGQVSGGLPFQDPYGRIPGVTIDNFSGIPTPSAPYFERNIDKQIYDNFSKVFGSHTVRVGATAQWMTKTENGPNPTNGTFRFTSTPDGYSSFANFLIGRAFQFTQSSRDIIPHLNYTNIEAYLQDDWKVTPRLTVNLGFRYSFFPTATDSNNVLNNFDPAAYNPAAAPVLNPTTGVFANSAVTPSNYVNGIIFPQGSSCAAARQLAPVTCSPYGSYVNPNSENNFAPRFGFAWDVTGKGTTAVRGGYGVFYDRTLNGIWEQNAFGDPPLVTALLIQNTSFDNPAGSAAPPAAGRC